MLSSSRSPRRWDPRESAEVARRYAEKSEEAKFTLQAVQDAVHLVDKTQTSIVQDKVASPAEPAKVIENFDSALTHRR